jgi:hypothetical protein
MNELGVDQIAARKAVGASHAPPSSQLSTQTAPILSEISGGEV